MVSTDTAVAGAVLLSRGDKSPSSLWPTLIAPQRVCGGGGGVEGAGGSGNCSWSPLI